MSNILPFLWRCVFGISLIILLSLLLVWAWDSLNQSRQRFHATTSQTEDCRQLAKAIAKITPSTSPSAKIEITEDQFVALIHQLFKQAGLDEQRMLRSMRPQPGGVSRDGNQGQKSVELSLEGITLQQFAGFLNDLYTANPSIEIAAINLQEPNGMGPQTLWRVDPLVLSYRVPALSSQNKVESANGVQ